MVVSAENGDFEDMTKALADRCQDATTFQKDSTEIPNWTVVKGNVDIIHRGGWGFGQSGDYHLDLNGGQPGAIEQVRCRNPIERLNRMSMMKL